MSHSTKEKAAGGDPTAFENLQNDPTPIAPKTQAENALESAFELAQEGVPCFPCNANKKPACAHWLKDATTDADSLRRLWRSSNAPLVGVPTGLVSGFDVLDVDPRHSGDQWLAENAYRLPITRKHHTRSGGVHLFFQHAEGLRNSASKIAPGIDVRGEGG